MFVRSPRNRTRRTGAFAAALLAWVFSLGPMTATVVYCISAEGHSGFELVGPAERDCASCCHEDETAPVHDGLGIPAGECTDVTLSSPQAVAAAGSLAAANPAPALESVLATPRLTDAARVQFVRAEPLAPPRGSAAMLQRSTVLRI